MHLNLKNTIEHKFSDMVHEKALSEKDVFITDMKTTLFLSQSSVHLPNGQNKND